MNEMGMNFMVFYGYFLDVFVVGQVLKVFTIGEKLEMRCK
jgi:hypothetical protein